MVDYSDCQEYFTQNTDVTGIGVRVAFYLQVNILSEYSGGAVGCCGDYLIGDSSAGLA